ncbi:hypothetical protein Hanom_Chr11g00976961 [Helianthus anomalus]
MTDGITSRYTSLHDLERPKQHFMYNNKKNQVYSISCASVYRVSSDLCRNNFAIFRLSQS